MHGEIRFDYAIDRPVLIGRELHCGDVIEIRRRNDLDWFPARVETVWLDGRPEWVFYHGPEHKETWDYLTIGTPARWPERNK